MEANDDLPCGEEIIMSGQPPLLKWYGCKKRERSGESVISTMLKKYKICEILGDSPLTYSESNPSTESGDSEINRI
jgi:hypothetical protein